MKNLTTLRNFLAATFVAVLAVSSAYSQNFENNGGTYEAACEAVIRFNDAAGNFTGSTVLGTSGAETSSTSTTGRLEGTVEYAADAVTVGGATAPRYFTNLIITGTGITLSDLFVAGEGCATSLLPLYDDLTGGLGFDVEGGTVTSIGGTFTYDGDNPQLIFAFDGTAVGGQVYNNLALEGTGSKTTNGDTEISGALTSTLGADLIVEHDFTLQGGATSITDGPILVNAGGLLDIQGANPLVANNTVTLSDDPTAEFALGAGSTFEITDNFLNNYDARTNMTFNPTSNVVYNSNNASVLSTAPGNDYGNLIFAGASAGGTYTINGSGAEPNINVVGNVSINGPDVSTGGAFLSMNDADGNITFNANEEIIGGVQRTDVNTTDSYRFNNALTYATFATTIPSGGWFRFVVNPGTQPDLISYDNTTDINRRIEVDYSYDGGTNDGTFELSELSLGFLEDEVPGGADQNDIRWFEGYDASNRGQIIATQGGSIALDNAASTPTLGNVEFTTATNNLTFVDDLSGGTNEPGGVDMIATQNLFVLSTAPAIIYSVRNGRWSDPGTWGGITPQSEDEVRLAHIIYTGIDAANGISGNPFGEDSFDGDENDVAVMPGTVIENSARVLADVVTIINNTDPYAVAGNAGPNRALVIGNNDATIASTGQAISFRSFLNSPQTTTSVWGQEYDVSGDYDQLNGIYVMSNDGTLANPHFPQVRFVELDNQGPIINNALIEIGNTP